MIRLRPHSGSLIPLRDGAARLCGTVRGDPLVHRRARRIIAKRCVKERVQLGLVDVCDIEICPLKKVEERLTAVESERTALEKRLAGVAEMEGRLAAVEAEREGLADRLAEVDDIEERMAAIEAEKEELRERLAVAAGIKQQLAAAEAEKDALRDRLAGAAETEKRLITVESERIALQQRLVEVAERMFLAEGTDLKEIGVALLTDKESIADLSD